jgi:hypothetical protein
MPAYLRNVRIVFFIYCLFFFHSGFSQMVITPAGDTLSVARIVKQYLAGENITIQRFKLDGDTNAIGVFHDTASVFGFENGIILSTGLAEHAVGPNGRPNAGANFGNNFFYDKDLLPGKSMCDGVKLEMDFIPQYDSVTIEYVFASEEYPEFVGNQISDQFGFYISPKGVKGFKPINMALLPGGEMVSINTVNANTHQEWYVSNNDHHDPAYNLTEYDGFTYTMTARAIMQAGKVYHLKLIIADLSDCEYDSAVILKANSFRSDPRVNP